MPSNVIFKRVSPIADSMDLNAAPVRALEPMIGYYTQTLGFSLITKDEASAVLRRDEVQIRLILQKDHDPGKSGSCYFEVSDVDALRRELEARGGKPGAIEEREHNGKRYRVFFAKEPYDDYCFCLGQSS